MATRTTTIRTTISESGRSADYNDADLTVDELLCAYYDCRRRKRNKKLQEKTLKGLMEKAVAIMDFERAATLRDILSLKAVES